MALLVESLILVCPSRSDPWSYPRSWDGTGDGRGREEGVPLGAYGHLSGVSSVLGIILSG